MLEAVLRGAVLALAAAGGLGLVLRAVRAGARLALRAAEATAASGLAELSAQRGDVTGLTERRARERLARRGLRRDGAAVALWALWLVVPPLAGWLPAAYALAAPLWLLPLPRVRPEGAAPADPLP